MLNKIKNLPKVDLHLHLDGSIPIELLAKWTKLSLDEVKHKASAPENCEDLKDYLTTFDFVLPYLQTKENLQEATYELLKTQASDGVRYCEIRFAPLQHTEEGLSAEEIIDAVSKGIKQAEEGFNINSRIIICCMRHHSNEANIKLVDSVKEANNSYVVGFDFAGNEIEGANSTIKEVTDKVHQVGYKLTLHSGETGHPQNVIDALELGARRIGHGIAVAECDKARSKVIEEEALLEICPVSNVQTRAVDSLENYPLRFLLDEGVNLSINTDNTTVSNTYLTKEYYNMHSFQDLTLEEIKELNLKAIDYAFCSDDLKEKIKEEIKAYEI